VTVVQTSKHLHHPLGRKECLLDWVMRISYLSCSLQDNTTCSKYAFALKLMMSFMPNGSMQPHTIITTRWHICMASSHDLQLLTVCLTGSCSCFKGAYPSFRVLAQATLLQNTRPIRCDELQSDIGEIWICSPLNKCVHHV